MEWDGMEATKQGRQPKLNKKGRIQPLLGLDKTSANMGKKKTSYSFVSPRLYPFVVK